MMFYRSHRMAGLLVMVGGLSVQKAQALELSATSGLLQTREIKSGGRSTGSSTTITVGSRVSDFLSPSAGWLAEVGLTQVSYDSDVGSAPDSFTGITLGGGYRIFFPDFSEKVLPFLGGKGGFRKEQVSRDSGLERTGVFYSGFFGLRMTLSKLFFAEIETPLFQSSIFETTEIGSSDSGTTEAKESDIYVATRGSLSSTEVGIGIKF